MSPVLAGYYTLYPRGMGAASGPIPNGYVMVSRWVNAQEAKLWMRNGGTYIPPQVGAGGRVYVTMPGAIRPAGTDPIRIDFGVPQTALQLAGRSDWRQLLQNLANVPIYNVTIHVPNSIPASQITGRT
jgi:filamentous hemagglutinin